MLPISIQLYTLREEAKKDFVNVLKRVAAIGYKGVEPAGFFNLTPAELRKIVNDLGMTISSTHSPWASPNNLNEVIDTLGILGTNMVAAGFGPDDFKDLEAIKRTAEKVEMMHATLAKAGITMTIHNHWWEFEKINGELKFDIFARLAPNVKFELDTYWAANFGENDSAEIVKRYATRCPLYHIKDGPFIKDEKLLPVGSGKMNFPKVIKAIDEKITKWIVVEQDNSATDMFTCVEKSYRYLVENKLGIGNK